MLPDTLNDAGRAPRTAQTLAAMLGRCARRAMHGEIAGRRADDPACSRKGTRDQRGVGQMADIDGHIHPALQRIAGLHPQMYLDAERWMLLAEGGDQRRQLRRGKSRRRADAKRVAMQVVWR